MSILKLLFCPTFISTVPLFFDVILFIVLIYQITGSDFCNAHLNVGYNRSNVTRYNLAQGLHYDAASNKTRVPLQGHLSIYDPGDYDMTNSNSSIGYIPGNPFLGLLLLAILIVQCTDSRFGENFFDSLTVAAIPADRRILNVYLVERGEVNGRMERRWPTLARTISEFPEPTSSDWNSRQCDVSPFPISPHIPVHHLDSSTSGTLYWQNITEKEAWWPLHAEHPVKRPGCAPITNDTAQAHVAAADLAGNC